MAGVARARDRGRRLLRVCYTTKGRNTPWNLLIADLPLAPVVLVSLVFLGSLFPFEVRDLIALTSLQSPVGSARHLCRANAQRFLHHTSTGVQLGRKHCH